MRSRGGRAGDGNVKFGRNPPMSVWFIGVAALILTSGCVERFVRIKAVPTNAEIFVNGRHVGPSPVEVPFEYYGTMRVDVAARGYEAETQWLELSPPWYQRPPFDFFSELVDPRTHVDVHEARISLKLIAPLSSLASEDPDTDSLMQRAQQLQSAIR